MECGVAPSVLSKSVEKCNGIRHSVSGGYEKTAQTQILTEFKPSLKMCANCAHETKIVSPPSTATVNFDLLGLTSQPNELFSSALIPSDGL